MTFGEVGCCPSHHGELLNVANMGYFASLLTTSHRERVSKMEDSEMTFGEGGCWPSHRGELLDAATMGRSMNLLAAGYGV
jgi:GR25 family glycosyltransferase involved in LPS biosynthesis